MAEGFDWLSPQSSGIMILRALLLEALACSDHASDCSRRSGKDYCDCWRERTFSALDKTEKWVSPPGPEEVAATKKEQPAQDEIADLRARVEALEEVRKDPAER